MGCGTALALLLAMLFLLSGIASIPFLLTTTTEVPLAVRLWIVATMFAMSAFLGRLAFSLDRGELPGPWFWLLLPFALVGLVVFFGR